MFVDLRPRFMEEFKRLFHLGERKDGRKTETFKDEFPMIGNVFDNRTDLSGIDIGTPTSSPHQHKEHLQISI